MKIGENKSQPLSARDTRLLIGVGGLVALIVLFSTCSHLVYRELRGIVVGNTIDLASHAQGRIGDILLQENEPYQRGTLLVRLTNEGLQADVVAVEHEIDEVQRSLNLERSGQGLERRRYELLAAEAKAESDLIAAQVGIKGIDQILAGLELRRDTAAARLASAEELVAAQAMTAAELQERRKQALDATREYEEAAGRRRVLTSQEAGERRNLTFLRQRLENLDSDRTSMITGLEIQLADRQRDLTSLRNLLSELDIVADHDGVVTAIQRRPGEYVTAGQAILTVMTAADVWVEAYLPPSDKHSVHPGDRVRVTNSGGGSGTLDGRIDRILPVLRPFPGESGGMGSTASTYAVLIITLDDGERARTLLSPAQQVAAKVRRTWRLPSNPDDTSAAPDDSTTSRDR